MHMGYCVLLSHSPRSDGLQPSLDPRKTHATHSTSKQSKLSSPNCVPINLVHFDQALFATITSRHGALTFLGSFARSMQDSCVEMRSDNGTCSGDRSRDTQCPHTILPRRAARMGTPPRRFELARIQTSKLTTQRRSS